MNSRSQSRPAPGENARAHWRWFLPLCAIYLAIFFVSLWWVRPKFPAFHSALCDFFIVPSGIFAGFCCWNCGWRSQSLSKIARLGWKLLSVGLAIYAGGDMMWAYQNATLPAVPFPGFADVYYVASYVLMVAGMVCLTRSVAVAGRMRAVFDATIASVSLILPCWYFVMVPIWRGVEATPGELVLSLCYLGFDLLLFWSALITLFAQTARSRQALPSWLLAGGFAVLAFTDAIFQYATLNGFDFSGNWWESLWVWVHVFMAGAALEARARRAKVEPQSLESHSSAIQNARVDHLWLPYALALASLFSVAGFEWFEQGRISWPVSVAGLILFALITVRQILTISENNRLTRHLQNFASDLESAVAARTRQVEVLHQLTRAVNHTLSSKQVLETACAHSQSALSADAFVLWLAPRNSNDLELQKHNISDQNQTVLALLNEVQPSLQNKRYPLGNGGELLCAPIVWQDALLGILGVIHLKNAFETSDAALLEAMGLETGAALENARLYAAAVEAADRDSVTNLLNHRAIQERFHEQFERAARLERPLSAMMIDLNDFKLFNDTWGHPAGDRVLKTVAESLGEQTRAGDFVARYGGDEFFVVLPETGAEEATILAQRIRDHIALVGFRRPGDERVIPISLSFGIAAFPADATSRHELLATADANLYLAKHSEEKIRGTREVQRARQTQLAQGDSFGALDAIVNAVDNKDSYTRRHSEDVTEYALWIAEELALSEDTLRQIRLGAMLHDLGKICVPADILRKPGRLTEDELAVMKQHPTIGALIAGALPGMNGLVDLIKYHHERYDGKGYPEALKGENIPFLGRLLAVADAFSAMTTHRPYRKALSWELALEEIRKGSGTQFDPQLAGAFLKAVACRRELKLVAGEISIPRKEPAISQEKSLELARGARRVSAR